MKNRTLVLLSGEATTIPEAEARALFLAYDPDSRFDSPEKGVLIAESRADPELIASRIAFAKRVGPLAETIREAAEMAGGLPVKFRSFSLSPGVPSPDPVEYLSGLNINVDLSHPRRELTLIRGERDYVAVCSPSSMRQAWSERRPRTRAFFHPSAIFPKLSRALVNLSRCLRGQVFLDPFAGTGSLAIEAAMVGAEVVVWDQASRMAAGALSNMKHFGQSWAGVIRADTFHPPLLRVDAVATDIPYGRVSSTRGQTTRSIADKALVALSSTMARGRLLVLMHPQSMAVEVTADFSVLEQHHLHVHKLLTRTITVLRRK